MKKISLAIGAFAPMRKMLLTRLCRLLALALVGVITGGAIVADTNAASDAAQSSKTKPRYKLVAGMGYTVCERYIRMLNTYPPETPPMICEQKLHPSYPDFSNPQWDVLDVMTHIDLVRQIERWLHSKNSYLWENRQPPTAAEWLMEVERRIRSGELVPRLRRAHLALAGDRREWLLAYTRDVGKCDKDIARASAPYLANDGVTIKSSDYGPSFKSRDYLFLYDDQGRISPRKLAGRGDSTSGEQQIVLHNNKPYIVTTYSGSPNTEPVELHVDVAKPYSGSASGPERPFDYVVMDRCVVHLDLSKTSTAR